MSKSSKSTTKGLVHKYSIKRGKVTPPGHAFTTSSGSTRTHRRLDTTFSSDYLFDKPQACDRTDSPRTSSSTTTSYDDTISSSTTHTSDTRSSISHHLSTRCVDASAHTNDFSRHSSLAASTLLVINPLPPRLSHSPREVPPSTSSPPITSTRAHYTIHSAEVASLPPVLHPPRHAKQPSPPPPPQYAYHAPHQPRLHR